MKSLWIIEHDNGVYGQRGYSEFIGTREEMIAEVDSMLNQDIFVYSVIIMEEGFNPFLFCFLEKNLL